MNIIELAREAGLYLDGENTQQPLYVLSMSELTRFAALVRAQTLEEAAGVCDDKHDEWRFGDGEDAASGPKDCAAAIRALKEQT